MALRNYLQTAALATALYLTHSNSYSQDLTQEQPIRTQDSQLETEVQLEENKSSLPFWELPVGGLVGASIAAWLVYSFYKIINPKE